MISTIQQIHQMFKSVHLHDLDSGVNQLKAYQKLKPTDIDADLVEFMQTVLQAIIKRYQVRMIATQLNQLFDQIDQNLKHLHRFDVTGWESDYFKLEVFGDRGDELLQIDDDPKIMYQPDDALKQMIHDRFNDWVYQLSQEDLLTAYLANGFDRKTVSATLLGDDLEMTKISMHDLLQQHVKVFQQCHLDNDSSADLIVMIVISVCYRNFWFLPRHSEREPTYAAILETLPNDLFELYMQNYQIITGQTLKLQLQSLDQFRKAQFDLRNKPSFKDMMINLFTAKLRHDSYNVTTTTYRQSHYDPSRICLDRFGLNIEQLAAGKYQLAAKPDYDYEPSGTQGSFEAIEKPVPLIDSQSNHDRYQKDLMRIILPAPDQVWTIKGSRTCQIRSLNDLKDFFNLTLQQCIDTPAIKSITDEKEN